MNMRSLKTIMIKKKRKMMMKERKMKMKLKKMMSIPRSNLLCLITLPVTINKATTRTMKTMGLNNINLWVLTSNWKKMTMMKL